jgi:hypothetical protein
VNGSVQKSSNICLPMQQPETVPSETWSKQWHLNLTGQDSTSLPRTIHQSWILFKSGTLSDSKTVSIIGFFFPTLLLLPQSPSLNAPARIRPLFKPIRILSS